MSQTNEICFRCASPLKEEAKFCSNCGSKETQTVIPPENRPFILDDGEELYKFVCDALEKDPLSIVLKGTGKFRDQMLLGSRTFQTVQNLFDEKAKKKLLREYNLEPGDDLGKLTLLADQAYRLETNFVKGLFGGKYLMHHLSDTILQNIRDISVSVFLYFARKMPALLSENIKKLPDNEQQLLKRVGTDLGKLFSISERLFELTLQERMSSRTGPPMDQLEMQVNLAQQLLFMNLTLYLPNTRPFKEVFKHRLHFINTYILYGELGYSDMRPLADVIGYPTIRCKLDGLEILLKMSKDLWTDITAEYLEETVFEIIKLFRGTNWAPGLPPFGYINKLLRTVLEKAKEYGPGLHKKLASASLLSTRLVWDTSNREDFEEKGSESLELLNNIFEEVLVLNFTNAYEGRISSHALFSILFESLCYYYANKPKELFLKIENLVTLNKEDIETIANIVMTANKGLKAYGKSKESKEITKLAEDLINLVPNEERKNEIIRSKEEYEVLSEFGFVESHFVAKEWPNDMMVQLSDQVISEELSLVINIKPVYTGSETMKIDSGTFRELTKNLEITDDRKGVFHFPEPKNGLEKVEDAGMILIMTKDKENLVDGVFFIGKLTQDRLPDGIAEIAPQAKQYTIYDWIFYGVAQTNGPLSKKEITLDKYIENWKDKNNLEEIKIYLLKVPYIGTFYW